MGLRVFVSFVRIHTRPTVPRGRSAAALRDDGEVPEILPPLKGGRVGKGLKRQLLLSKAASFASLFSRSP